MVITTATISAWLAAHMLEVVFALFVLAVIGWKRRDDIVALLPGKKPAPPAEIVMSDDNDLTPHSALSNFIDKLMNHPLIKKLDMSRDSIVRAIFNFWLVKMSDWIRTAPSVSDDQRKEGLKLLSGLAPIITVGSVELTEDEPPAPAPTPAPAPVLRRSDSV